MMNTFLFFTIFITISSLIMPILNITCSSKYAEEWRRLGVKSKDGSSEEGLIGTLHHQYTVGQDHNKNNLFMGWSHQNYSETLIMRNTSTLFSDFSASDLNKPSDLNVICVKCSYSIINTIFCAQMTLVGVPLLSVYLTNIGLGCLIVRTYCKRRLWKYMKKQHLYYSPTHRYNPHKCNERRRRLMYSSERSNKHIQTVIVLCVLLICPATLTYLMNSYMIYEPYTATLRKISHKFYPRYQVCLPKVLLVILFMLLLIPSADATLSANTNYDATNLLVPLTAAALTSASSMLSNTVSQNHKAHPTLLIVSQNINGLPSKVDEVNKMLSKRNPAFALIQETHISKEDEVYYDNKFPGYVAYWNSLTTDQMKTIYLTKKVTKITNKMKSASAEEVEAQAQQLNPSKFKKFSGVLTLIREDLAPYFRIKLGEDGRILTVITIKRKDKTKNKKVFRKNIAITNVYAPTGNHALTNSFFETTLSEHIIKVKKATKNVIIGGDMNATLNKDLDRWSNYAADTNATRYGKFEEFCNDYIDSKRVSSPTTPLHTWTSAKRATTTDNTTTTNISLMRLDYLLVTKHFHDSEILSADIAKVNHVASDHALISITIKDFRLGNYINDKLYKGREHSITKINTKNRKKSNKVEFHEKLGTFAKINTEISKLKANFTKQNLDIIVKNWNEMAYKLCVDIFGETTITINANKPHALYNNVELGLKKRYRTKLNNTYFAMLNAMKKKQYGGKNLHSAVHKLNKVWNGNQISTDLNTWQAQLDNIALERKNITKEIHQLTYNINKERIKKAIEKRTENGKTNLKKFYSDLNGKDLAYKRGISSVRETDEEGNILIYTERTAVLAAAKRFWQTMFKSYKTKPNQKPYWMNRKNNLTNADLLTAPITTNEVQEAIADLQINKATGTDNIPADFYKNLNREMIESLTALFNECLVNGTIPQTWKHGRIFPIFKGGDFFAQGNFRPICLLQIQYKLYTVVLNRRLTQVLENNKVVSKLQGAWQRDKYTTDNAKIAKAIINDSLTNNKELHALYIDIVKAYDKVEHWSITNVLEYYNFPPHFIKIIEDLYNNTTVDIITAHGLTEPIPVENGVRQGDPLSCQIFLLWINPLLTYLEDSGLGYTINKETVPGLSFADDLVAFADSYDNINKIYKIITDFCDYTGSKINAAKSRYTYNNTKGTEYNTLTFEGQKIKKLSRNEHYKYLGIMINLTLDWDKQKEVLEKSFIRHMNMLKGKRITAEQKINIINIIANAKIAYRMQVVDFDPEWIAKLDNAAMEVARLAIGLPGNTDKEVIWGERKYGGRGLQNLGDLQKAININTTLTHLLNTNNYVKTILLDTIPKNYVSTQQAFTEMQPPVDAKPSNNPICTMLRACAQLNVSIHETNFYKTISHINNNKSTIYTKMRLFECGFKNVNNLFNYNNQFLTIEDFKDKSFNIPPTLHQELKTELTTTDGSLKEMYSQTDRSLPYDLPKHNTKDVVIFAATDGSTTEDGKAGAGIYFGKNKASNQSLRLYGTQQNDAAELFAVDALIEMVPPNITLKIITDSESTINLITSFPKLTRSQIGKINNRSMIRRIWKNINTKNIKHELIHVYSHIEEKLTKGSPKQREEWKKKIEARKKAIGAKWNAYIQLNEGADTLAKLATQKQLPPIKTQYEGNDDFSIKQEGIIRETNTLKLCKQINLDKNQNKFNAKLSRGKPYRDNLIDIKASNRIFTKKEKEHESLRNFIHRARQTCLINRDQMHTRANGKKTNTYTNYMKKVYNDPHCIFCANNNINKIDDKYHLYTCAHHKTEHYLLNRKLLSIINKYTPENISEFPWWFSSPATYSEPNSEDPLIQEMINFDKKYGDRHYIPIHLRDLLIQTGVPEHKVNKCIDKLHYTHAIAMQEIYNKRIREHAKIKEAKKWRNKLVNQANKHVITQISKLNENNSPSQDGSGPHMPTTPSPPTPTPHTNQQQTTQQTKQAQADTIMKIVTGILNKPTSKPTNKKRRR